MKTHKQAILETAELKNQKYPKLLIWLKFSLIGGIIGGLFFGVFLEIMLLINPEYPLSLTAVARDILITSFAGFFVGFLPSSLTGLYMALREVIIVRIIDYLEIFLVGGLITIIFGLSWFVYDNKDNVLKDFYFYLSALFLGGMTATICGRLFLPKASQIL